jgi:O-antigen/teichoic acid export membrane protein
VMQVPAWLLAWRAYGPVRPSLGRASRPIARRVLSHSWAVAVVQLGGRLRARTDAVVIGAAMSVQSITPFALALRLAELVALVAHQFVTVVLPVASDAYVRGDVPAVRRVFLTTTRVTAAVCIPVVAVLVLLGAPILGLWVGSAYERYGYLVAVLAVAVALNVVVWPTSLVAQAMEQHRRLAWFAVANGVANLALSVALVFPLGLLGVALGTLIPSAVETVLILLWPVRRILGVTPAMVLRSIVLPLVVPTLVVFGALAAIRVMLVDGVAATLVAAVVASALYAIAYVRFGATSAERAVYVRALGVGRRGSLGG